MHSRRELIESLAAFALLPGMLQQPAAAGRTPIFQSDLPSIALSNWAVTAIEVGYAPGQSSAAHRHPGITIAYVLEGEVRSKVGEAPERTYKPGEMWIETPNQLHAVSANASKTQPARILAILLAEKGKPLTTPEKG